MRIRRRPLALLVALAALAVLVSLGLASRLRREAEPAAGSPALAEHRIEAEPSAAPRRSEPPAAAARPDPGPGHPVLARHREELVFRAAVRAFFDEAGELPEATREQRAAEIRAGVEARERDGRLVPNEALVLKLALLRATIDDPAVLEHEIETQTEAYAVAAERRRAAQARDPRAERYRRGQEAIAREVMALDEIPGGLTREAYLKDRLRELRTEVYGR